MAHFNPCCCEGDCFGVIGYDLYNLQVQNFASIFIDGKDFNSYPVKFGVGSDPIANGAFAEYFDLEGEQIIFDVTEPRWPNTHGGAVYKCGYPNPFNVNKDPVETQWVNPLSPTLLYYGLSNNYYRLISRTEDAWSYPVPQTSRFYPKNHTNYGQLTDYAVGAPVQSYLFTSQPGRFVLQSHSEAPGNHYVGLNENGHIACLPFPETDPNYWAPPHSHLSPKPQIENLTYKVFARGLGTSRVFGNSKTGLDYETLMVEPFASQPLYPIGKFRGSQEALLELAKSAAKFQLPVHPEQSQEFRNRFIAPVTVGAVQAGQNIFNVRLFPDLPDPITDPPQPNNRTTPVTLAPGEPHPFPGTIKYLCPCKYTFSEVYAPDAQLDAFWFNLSPNLVNTSELQFDGEVFPVKSINSTHPKANMYQWTSPNTWRKVENTNNKLRNLDSIPYAGSMPPRPPKYFKMPKKGKIFTGPLFAQNRWETGGTYFGKHGNRGHTNWTQAGWLTWSGNTSAPTSLLTDPENKQYYRAEVNAFKKMMNCCAKEKTKGTKCVNGKWVTTCNDLSTLVWKERYPKQACGVGATADPPPPCGARKLVWSVYSSYIQNNGSVWDAGIEHSAPIAWGDFIFYDDLHGLSGATYDYELVTRWTITDWYKNRCLGFDVPGVCLAPGATGMNAGMSWEEMQNLFWTPLYPKQKSVKKQCLKDELKFELRGTTYDVDKQIGYDSTKFPPSNPFGISGVTTDLGWIANSLGWFKSYKGFTAGIRLLEDFSLFGVPVGGWTLSPNDKYIGECGLVRGWYWEEDQDDIYYLANPLPLQINGFDRESLPPASFVWLISCSVPQYHKEKDQPKTKESYFTAPIEGELTGLGWSKNMGIFHPCGEYFYGVSGASGATWAGGTGEQIREFLGGFTFASRNISKKYKQCHGCTWSNPPIWVGIDDSDWAIHISNTPTPHKAYWAPIFSYISHLMTPATGFLDIINPCSNTSRLRDVPEAVCLAASRQEGDGWSINNLSSYANVTFADYRIPYKVGQETYRTTPDFDPNVTRDSFIGSCKDCINYMIYGQSVPTPDPDNSC
jgi:hypothetical protein